MTRFNIGGEYLDTPSDLALTFSKKNILFAFDNIECEYTTSFDIPKTAKNERLMKYASNIHTSGDMMRTKIDVQMQDGVVVKDGYIYIVDYDNEKNVYKATFVTGELLGLKAIKDAGAISEYINTEIYATYSQANQVNANASGVASMPFACVKYKQDYTGLCKPSVLVDKLVEACAQYFGVQVTGSSLSGIRIVPAEMGVITKKKTTITSTKGARQEEFGYYVNVATSSNNISLKPSSIRFDKANLIEYRDESGFYWEYYSGSAGWYLEGWEAVEDTDILLPNDMPSNIYMVSELGVIKSQYDNTWRLADFYGGHAFVANSEGYITRDDAHTLAGKTIHINKGQCFAFVDVNDISIDRPTGVSGHIAEPVHYAHNSQSYYEYGQPSYQHIVYVTHTYTIAAGSKVYFDGNVPDMTFSDLLKIISVIKGKQILYTNAGGIQFVDLSFDDWNEVRLDNVIASKTMSRKFSDYAQVNRIEFESDSNVFAWEVLSDEYNIHNDSIDAEKVLATIPCSEGGVYNDNGTPVGYIRFNAGEELGNTNMPYILQSNATNGSTYMSRISINKNAGIQNLCDVSSSLVVTSRMSLLQYNSITPTTTIWNDGAKYVWTEVQWSKGVATLTLAKI